MLRQTSAENFPAVPMRAAQVSPSSLEMSARVMPLLIREYMNPALKLSPAPIVDTVSVLSTGKTIWDSPVKTWTGSAPQVQMKL